MNFPSIPQLWNQIAMILAWYWDQENNAGPEQVARALHALDLTFWKTGKNTTARLALNETLNSDEPSADQWWLLLDALEAYKSSPINYWNDELQAFYQIAHFNYWKLTLPPNGLKTPGTKVWT